MEFEWMSSQQAKMHCRQLVCIQSSGTLQSTSSCDSPTLPPLAQTNPPPPARNNKQLPVPLITIGKVFAPIPPRNFNESESSDALSPVSAEALAAARHLGLVPMLLSAMSSSPETSSREFWDVAALTDPLMASNLSKGAKVDNKRVLFVERGAASALARGKDQLVGVSYSTKSMTEDAKNGSIIGLLSNWFKAGLNPLVGLQGVCAAMACGRTKEATLEAAQSHLEAIEDSCNNDFVKSYTLVRAKKKTENNKESTTHDFLSTTTTAPGLAHIPVRLALHLLKGASEYFTLCTGRGDRFIYRDGPSRGGEERSLPESYRGASSLDSLLVHFIPGFEISMSTPAGKILFTPAFLSESALISFYRLGMKAYTKGMLKYAKMKKDYDYNRFCINLARIAGSKGSSSGRRFQSPSSGVDDREDDREDDDEPPEMADVIREMLQEEDLQHQLVDTLASGGVPFSNVAMESMESIMHPMVAGGATLVLGAAGLWYPFHDAMFRAGTWIAMQAFSLFNMYGNMKRPDVVESVPLSGLVRSMARQNNALQACDGGGGVDCHQRDHPDTTTLTNSDVVSTTLALSGVIMAAAAKLVADEQHLASACLIGHMAALSFFPSQFQQQYLHALNPSTIFTQLKSNTNALHAALRILMSHATMENGTKDAKTDDGRMDPPVIHLGSNTNDASINGEDGSTSTDALIARHQRSWSLMAAAAAAAAAETRAKESSPASTGRRTSTLDVELVAILDTLVPRLEYNEFFNVFNSEMGESDAVKTLERYTRVLEDDNMGLSLSLPLPCFRARNSKNASKTLEIETISTKNEENGGQGNGESRALLTPSQEMTRSSPFQGLIVIGDPGGGFPLPVGGPGVPVGLDDGSKYL